MGERWGLAFVAVVLVLAPASLAHVPQDPDRVGTPEAPFPVAGPSRSQVFYLDLASPEDTAVFSFALEAGDRIHLELVTSARNPAELAPLLVLTGPGLDEATPPAGTEVYPDQEAILLEGRVRGPPAYEPFAPSALVPLGELDVRAPETGTYLVTIGQGVGAVGLVTGTTESLSAYEWLVVPFRLFEVRGWEDQSALSLAAPYLLVLAGGLWTLARGRRMRTPPGVLVALGGLVILGSAAATFLQFIEAARYAWPGEAFWTTAAFIVLPGLAGVELFRRGARMRTISHLERALLAAATLVAVGFWAGLLVGPLFVALGLVFAPVRARARAEDEPTTAGSVSG